MGLPCWQECRTPTVAEFRALRVQTYTGTGRATRWDADALVELHNRAHDSDTWSALNVRTFERVEERAKRRPEWCAELRRARRTEVRA